MNNIERLIFLLISLIDEQIDVDLRVNFSFLRIVV